MIRPRAKTPYSIAHPLKGVHYTRGYFSPLGRISVMKQVNTFLKLFLVLVLVGLVVWLVFFRKPVVTIEYKYITDTIIDSVPYAVPEPYEVYTPPITLIEYVVDSSEIERLRLLLHGQYIIVASLQDSIEIHENFLKSHPSNPKLLGLDLSRDTLQFGLLEISGIPKGYIWPIDLNYYSYRWNLSQGFTREEIKPTVLPPTLKEPFANYYVGGAVDIWNLMPQVSFRAEKELASVRLYIDTRIGLLDVNTSNLSLGIEYHINGKKHR